MADKKKRTRRNVGKAVAYIKASFNNTIVTVTDAKGEVIAWDSAGTIGYKGSRKSTPFAAQRAAQKVAEKIRKMGVPRSRSPRQRPRLGSRVGDPRARAVGHRCQSDRGRDASAAQRLPSTEETARLRSN